MLHTFEYLFFRVVFSIGHLFITQWILSCHSVCVCVFHLQTFPLPQSRIDHREKKKHQIVIECLISGIQRIYHSNFRSDFNEYVSMPFPDFSLAYLCWDFKCHRHNHFHLRLEIRVWPNLLGQSIQQSIQCAWIGSNWQENSHLVMVIKLPYCFGLIKPAPK